MIWHLAAQRYVLLNRSLAKTDTLNWKPSSLIERGGRVVMLLASRRIIRADWIGGASMATLACP